jgi:tetratricopeptide (TPR) repeat protein
MASAVPDSQLKSPDVAALLADAVASHQAGKLVDAERAYNQILAVDPQHCDCLHLLGVILNQRGKHAQAVAQIDLSLAKNPINAAAWSNRGTALYALKRLDEAIASYDRALAIAPNFAFALSNRGAALYALKRFDEALTSYDCALAVQPDYVEALSNRGNTLKELKRFDEALASFDRALAVRPDYAEAHLNRGIVLRELDRPDEALAAYDRALAIRPDFAEALSNRGAALRDLKRIDEALASCDRALALQPQFAEAHANRANALQSLKRFEEALASYDCAAALRPDLAELHYNRGNALYMLRRFEDALTSYQRVYTAQPDFADAHFNEALCRLLIGDFRRGWEKHEWRWQAKELRGSKRNFPQPLWTGIEEIAGRTILLYAEQGFGDTLQFCRYVPLVAARGARVIFEVQPPLHDLMCTLTGGTQTISSGGALPTFDLHCPLLSLPWALATWLDTIPATTPYLRASENKTRAWRDRLGKSEKPRVGLVWAGSARKELPNGNLIDELRSVPFEQFAPLLENTACEFCSLQKGEDAVRQLRQSNLRRRVVDWTDDLYDFSDTAALIENLDLVITVDTAVAHLAGALNKPFWLLNRYDTCWRWLLDREDSPWYPTARLFRQDGTRTWDSVFARVRAALHDHDFASTLSKGPA